MVLIKRSKISTKHVTKILSMTNCAPVNQYFDDTRKVKVTKYKVNHKEHPGKFLFLLEYPDGTGSVKLE